MKGSALAAPLIPTVACPHCGGELRSRSFQEQADQAVANAQLATAREAADRARETGLRSIVEVVAAFYRVAVPEMYGKSHQQEFVLPRQIAFYLMSRSSTETSYTQIARVVERDHSTVIHGVRRIEREMVRSPWVREDIEMLSARLGIAS